MFYNEKSKTFFLETKNSSYVMQVLSNGILYHSYYGLLVTVIFLRMSGRRKEITWVMMKE